MTYDVLITEPSEEVHDEILKWLKDNVHKANYFWFYCVLRPPYTNLVDIDKHPCSVVAGDIGRKYSFIHRQHAILFKLMWG